MAREALGSPARHLTTLIYAERAGAVALMHRRKAPNRGLWSPPGGKIEPDETPLACALRELAEETGLVADGARLRAVVSEHDPVRDEAWLMFVFHAPEVAGALAGDGREGDVAWVPHARIGVLPTPPADAHIHAAVFDPAPGVAWLDLRFDGGRLARVSVARSP